MERNTVWFDIRSPLGAFHYATFLARLHQSAVNRLKKLVGVRMKPKQARTVKEQSPLLTRNMSDPLRDSLMVKPPTQKRGTQMKSEVR